VERTTIAGETEVLGENLPSATLSHHKSHMPRSGFEPRTAATLQASSWVALPVSNHVFREESIFVNITDREIRGFCTEYCLLAYDVTSYGKVMQKYVLPSCLFLLGLLFNPEDGSSVFCRNFYYTARRHIPKYDTLHCHRPKNLKSKINIVYFIITSLIFIKCLVINILITFLVSAPSFGLVNAILAKIYPLYSPCLYLPVRMLQL
jgi:hypothetical protein